MMRMKDIAKLAGVSPTTVSNVLHGKTDKMSKHTFHKVKKILKETDYTPFAGGALLAANKSCMNGVIAGAKINMQDVEKICKYEKESYEKQEFLLWHQYLGNEDTMLFIKKWKMKEILFVGMEEEDVNKLKKECSHQEMHLIIKYL